MVDIVVPALGLAESDEIVVSCWLVHVGEEVFEGDRLVELLIGEVTFDVSAPVSGYISHIAAATDSVVAVDSVLGAIRTLEAPE